MDANAPAAGKLVGCGRLSGDASGPPSCACTVGEVSGVQVRAHPWMRLLLIGSSDLEHLMMLQTLCINCINMPC